jgi:hypothetical protein
VPEKLTDVVRLVDVVIDEVADADAENELELDWVGDVDDVGDSLIEGEPDALADWLLLADTDADDVGESEAVGDAVALAEGVPLTEGVDDSEGV